MALSLCRNLIFFLMAVIALPLHAETSHQLVRELHRSATHPGMALVGDYLYVSDMDADFNHEITVYRADDLELVATHQLVHSITGLYAHGDRGVIAVGRTSQPAWASHLTIIVPDRNGFRLQHQRLGSQVIAESAVSDGQNIYLNEKGSRGIYRLRAGTTSLTKLPFEISGPGQNMQIDAGKLYAVELRDLFSPGDESIVEIDLASGQGRRLVPSEQLLGLRNLAVVDGLVIGVEQAANSAILVDPVSDRLIDRVAIKAGAYGIARYGSCAAIVSDESKTISFVRHEEDKLVIVGSWDLGEAGDRLKQPRSLAVDGDTGRIFVRSNYLCPSCSVTQSSVFVFADAGATLQRCR